MADSLNDALQELDEMSVVTSGDTLVINNDLRTITVPNNFIFGVYNDKNVLSVDFEMPRYYDDIDLSTFSIQINYQAASGVGNIHEITTPVIGTDKITFEWLLDRGVFLAAGDVTFIVCLREILSGSEGTVLREFNTTVAKGKVLEGLEVEDPEDPEAYSIIAHLKSIDQRVTAQANDVANKFAAVSSMASEATSKYNEAIAAINGAKEFYGSPLVAATAAGMTDQTKVYVYTGNETGYTFGNWYYHNGSAWVSGGVYNSAAVNTDETLSVSGMAADSKKVGDEISGLKEDLSHDGLLNNGQVVSGSISPTTSGTRYNSLNNLTFYPGVDYTLKFTSTGLNGQCSLQIRKGSTLVKDLGSINTSDTQTKAFTTDIVVEDAYISHYCYATSGSITTEITASNANNKLIKSLRTDVRNNTKTKANNVIAYYTEDGFSFAVNSRTGICELTLNNANGIVIRANEQTITISRADILSAASAAGITVSDNTISGNSFAVYYDFGDGSVKASSVGVSGNVYLDNSVILFAHHYNSFTGGLIVDSHVERMFNQVEDTANQTQSYVVRAEKNDQIMSGAIIEGDISPTTSGSSLVAISNISLYKGVRYRLTTYGDSSLNNQCSVRIRNASTSTNIKTFSAVTANTVRVNDFVVAETVENAEVSHYCYSTAGKVYDRLETVGSDVIPTFFETQLATKIQSISNNMEKAGIGGETFIFITDLHWETNFQNSPKLFRRLLEGLNINQLLCGGDLVNQGEPDDVAKTIRDCVRSFNFKNTFFPCAIGNHDDNSNQSDPSKILSESAVFALMEKQVGDNVTFVTDGPWNYYYDIVNTKTRVIVLDTGADGTFNEYAELYAMLNGIPSDYHAVIVAHWLYNSGAKSTFCVNLEGIIDSYNAKREGTSAGIPYDFTNADGNVAIVLCGHTHLDMDWISPNGVPFVLTDCDSAERTKSQMVYNTVDEQCFDVVTLDYTGHKAYFVRIGRGNDREFTI